MIVLTDEKKIKHLKLELEGKGEVRKFCPFPRCNINIELSHFYHWLSLLKSLIFLIFIVDFPCWNHWFSSFYRWFSLLKSLIFLVAIVSLIWAHRPHFWPQHLVLYQHYHHSNLYHDQHQHQNLYHHHEDNGQHLQVRWSESSGSGETRRTRYYRWLSS